MLKLRFVYISFLISSIFAFFPYLTTTSCAQSPKGVAPIPNVFQLSIDETLWEKWGFKYPVTYVFNLFEMSQNAEVMWKSSMDDSWAPLSTKKETDFFNGLDVVRFDETNKKAYVSIGYKTSNVIYLEFKNITKVTYDSTAQYYDNRKAVYTLSMDNWGMNNKEDLPGSAGSSYPGIECRKNLAFSKCRNEIK